MLLADELRGKGFSVWIDQRSIGGAKNWSAEIVEAINACSTMLVLLSPESIQSRNVVKEVQLASQKGRNILPVLIERVTLPVTLEYPLVGLQHVYFHDRLAIWNALELLKNANSSRGADVSSAVGQPSPAVLSASVRVAVLPFDDLSPEHDNQWFADGMMDELISTLGHLERVKVPARSDVLHYREHKKKSREIAAELGVRYLIEGGVRKAKDKIRINASLTDTEPGEQIWSSKFDGTFDDVFDFQESVARNIADALKLQLTPKELHEIEDRGTDNAEAYELYLKGRHEQYYLTKESYLRALDFYEQAAKLDPNYANAYIGMASVCCAYYREYSKSLSWLKRADEQVAIAEQISGETSKTLSMKGTIKWLSGNDEEAISILMKATELDKHNNNAYNILGMIYMAQANYTLAHEAFEKVTQFIETTVSYYNLLISLNEKGDSTGLKMKAELAIPIFERHIKMEPYDSTAAVQYAFVLLWAGRMEEAASKANRLLSRDDLSGASLFNLGCLFDWLGNPHRFLSLFRKAIDNGYQIIKETQMYEFRTKDPGCEMEFRSIVDQALSDN